MMVNLIMVKLNEYNFMSLEEEYSRMMDFIDNISYDDSHEREHLKLCEYNYSEAKTIDLLRTLNVVRSYFSKCGEGEFDEDFRNKVYKMYDALKQELSTREHIPNKLERKKIRQEKFKMKKT